MIEAAQLQLIIESNSTGPQLLPVYCMLCHCTRNLHIYQYQTGCIAANRTTNNINFSEEKDYK